MSDARKVFIMTAKKKGPALKMLSAVIFLLLLLNRAAGAGDFRVLPIKLVFDKNAKTGIITIINEGKEKLHLQMKAFEWTQDGEARDRYTETDDLIFFPKIMNIGPQEERILRVGIKSPAVDKERTYRLFIEEIPVKKAAQGVQVTIAIRFGVPIFVKPPEEVLKGEIVRADIENGVLKVRVRNSGNVHFIIQSIDIVGRDDRGSELFKKELSGWYLLSGTEKTYTAEVPGGTCRELQGIDISVKTEKFDLKKKLDVNMEGCPP